MYQIPNLKDLTQRAPCHSPKKFIAFSIIKPHRVIRFPQIPGISSDFSPFKEISSWSVLSISQNTAQRFVYLVFYSFDSRLKISLDLTFHECNYKQCIHNPGTCSQIRNVSTSFEGLNHIALICLSDLRYTIFLQSLRYA